MLTNANESLFSSLVYHRTALCVAGCDYNSLRNTPMMLCFDSIRQHKNIVPKIFYFFIFALIHTTNNILPVWVELQHHMSGTHKLYRQ